MIKNRPRITVFDSGAGGLSVVRALVATRLPVNISYAADSAWFPYGNRDDSALKERLPGLMSKVATASACDLLIVACNTASTLAIDAIRAVVQVPVVGVVPAIKPAVCMTNTGVIGLLATPRTIARAYTDSLIADHAGHIKVLRHGPPDLAIAAEQVLAGRSVDPAIFERAMEGLLMQEALAGAPMDVVVLACTHYPFVRDELAGARALGGREILWLDSGEAIARRAASLLGLVAGTGEAATERAFTTGRANDPLHDLVRRLGFEPDRSLADSPQER